MSLDPGPIIRGVRRLAGVILGVALRIFEVVLHVLSIFK